MMNPRWRLWSNNTIAAVCNVKGIVIDVRKLYGKCRFNVIPGGQRTRQPYLQCPFGPGGPGYSHVDEECSEAEANELCDMLRTRLGEKSCLDDCLPHFLDWTYGPDTLRPQSVEASQLIIEYADQDLSQELKVQIEGYCLRRGCIAFIDVDPESARSRLHAIQHPKENKVWTHNEIVEPSERKLEIKIRQYYEGILRKRGRIGGEAERHCAAGEADIVTDNAIYEVKLIYWRSDFFKALGQVLLYKHCLGKEKAFIICAFSGNTVLEKWVCDMDKWLKQIGLDGVIVWPREP